MENKKCYDVSNYQKGLTLPDDTHHVIIKLGQKDFIDGMCEEFIKQCKEKNISFDFYWFMDSTTIENLSTEFNYLAKYFNVMCDKYKLDKYMHIWLDFEKENQDNKLMFVRALGLAENYKLNVGIYTCWDWYRRIMKDNSNFKDTPVWIAWWGVPTSYVESIPNIHFHQYGTTIVNGFTVDTNTELHCCSYNEVDNNDVVGNENKENKDNGIALYTSAYSETPVTDFTGKYYYYDDKIVNGKRRITTDSFYVGKLPVEKYVTGWISIDEENKVPDKGEYFDGSEKRNIYASAYDVTPVGTTNSDYTYYYYDDEIINGKRRVTIDLNHVGDNDYGKYVTGWVMA